MTSTIDKTSHWSDVAATSIFVARRAMTKDGGEVKASEGESHRQTFSDDFARRIYASRKVRSAS